MTLNRTLTTKGNGRATTLTSIPVTEAGAYYFACDISEVIFHCDSGQKVEVIVTDGSPAPEPEPEPEPEEG